MHVQTEQKPYDTINVTPMLDLAYVLLVIFILMTTASVSGLQINLPKPSSKPSLERKEVKIIQVMADGSLRLNGAGVTTGELEGQLTSALARDPETPVVVKGDTAVAYESVIQVIDLLSRVGVGNIGLVTAKIGT
jgi:biopolymer transport protein ExbD